MPQPQHSLIHVLLLWTTILSIFQIVFITLFFTTGRLGMSQNSSAVAPERTVQIQANNTPSSPSDHGLLFGKGTMLTFKTDDKDGNIIRWKPKIECKGPISESGDRLKILKDGYYFLNLQVTLLCKTEEPNNQHHVTLKTDQENKIILHSQINTNTCSTGLLGKVEELSAGWNLEVLIEPRPHHGINITEFMTYLNVIYMVKP